MNALPFLLATTLAATPDPMPSQADLERMSARYAPVDLVVDVTALPENELKALARVLEAARVMDVLFMRQAWPGNPALQLALMEDDSPLGKARLEYFFRNKGPWSRLDHAAAFIPGAPAPLPQAGFYPADATKEEVEAWFKGLPEPDRTAAKGFFTTVRRAPDRRLVIVPYSVEYQPELEMAARLLHEAAALTTQPTLKAYLEKRARAFLSNDYYDSDVAWMELDATIEPTIGPYETYEDGWFSMKAAFEAFITLRDDAETKKLSMLSGHLQAIEDNLPIDAQHRNAKLGAMAPIRVVNQLFASGDAARGVATAAFNLPNDERVVKEKGSKRVMLRNVQEQKFNVALVPISRVVLSAADQKLVAFDAFFTHILMHELMHGLGPHNIKVKGRETTVRAEFKDLYSTFEEAKADASGMYALQFLVDKGVLPKAMEQTMYVTFLASTFRTIRFGIDEAHGRGMAIQLNYLLDQGAFRLAADGTYSVNDKKVKAAFKQLTRELMMMQAEGNAAKAADWAKRMGVLRPETKAALERLKGVPVDIAPRFVTARQVMAQHGSR